MSAALSIGEFSRITHLSIKTLRRYHEAGLLVPARVDPGSAYRYYSLDQVPTAQVIHRFRELGMPVKEVGQLVGVTDPDLRAAVIAQHLRRLEAQLDDTRAAVVSLRRLLEPDPTPLEVAVRRVEATSAAGVRGVVGLDHALAWYADAMSELDGVLAAAGVAAAGPPGGLYDNELFTEERGTMVVYVPVADAPARTGRVEPVVVPAAELATTLHTGAHDDIDITYAALGTFVSEQALAVVGPVREVYLVGPRDTDDRAAWRTEIGWPIFQTTGEYP
jgi:DNA-binding transcriptional MerR regulator